MNIGHRMKLRRLELGLSQKEVADKVGVSTGLLDKWETEGDGATLRSSKTLALAGALKTTCDYLLGSKRTFDTTEEEDEAFMKLYELVFQRHTQNDAQFNFKALLAVMALNL